MKDAREVYVVAAVRTPVGKARGVLSTVRPDDLLAHVLMGALNKVPALDAAEVEDVVIGCAMPEAEQGMNVARIASLLAGLPASVPAMTINRFCSSGLQAISIAADRIMSGAAEVAIAGGVESMSMVPMGGNKYSANPAFFNKEHQGIALGMGMTAENVAHQWNISRERQDAFSLSSHQKALHAINDGLFKEEILPIKVRTRSLDLATQQIIETSVQIENDEGPRKETSLEALANLRSVFAARGTVTAGNASQTSDGAAALVLMSKARMNALGLTPLARWCGYAVAGLPPEIMGVGPSLAVPKLLKQTGIKLEDVSWIELNEAFAAQSLAVIQDLNLDLNKVNPQGGAIALGHPLGATGAIRAATIIHGLRRMKQRYGIVTMCIGTGMGAAGLFEACF